METEAESWDLGLCAGPGGSEQGNDYNPCGRLQKPSRAVGVGLGGELGAQARGDSGPMRAWGWGCGETQEDGDRGTSLLPSLRWSRGELSERQDQVTTTSGTATHTDMPGPKAERD